MHDGEKIGLYLGNKNEVAKNKTHVDLGNYEGRTSSMKFFKLLT